jgi:hypothetical protein
MDAAARSLRSRLGGYRTAALYDAREINAKARATYRDSFRAGHACQLCPPATIAAGLPESEIARRAVALRREHFTRLSIRSASVRSNKKAGRGGSDSRGPAVSEAGTRNARLTTR